MPVSTASVLSLDVGGKRIGVAIASLEARLARPLTTIDTAEAMDKLDELIRQESVARIIVGLPRNQEGKTTEQTVATQLFADKLIQFGLPIDFQDESVTSKQAEAELKAGGKPYRRGDVDALAATYILDDWLLEHPEMNNE